MVALKKKRKPTTNKPSQPEQPNPMRHLTHIAARLYGAPLLLLPSVAESFSQAFQHLLHMPVNMPSALALQQNAEPRAKPAAFASNVSITKYADKPYAVTDQGIGLLGIYGALVQRAGQIDANCMPMASYQALHAQWQAMQADPDVKAILAEYDTPGGEAAGNFQTAAAWLAARGNKPTWAHLNEGAYSAGYSLAATADRLIIPTAGSAGSIGVVMLHVDQSVKDTKAGLAYTYIHAGARKVDGNPHEPLSPAARAGAEAEVQRLYDIFTAHVAQARGMDQQAVRATEAGVLPATEAKRQGLVDAIGSFEDTLAEFTAHVTSTRSATVGGTRFATAGGLAAQHNPGETPMSHAPGAAPANTAADQTPNALAAEHPAQPQAHQPTQPGATAADVVAAVTLSRQTERARISAILTHAEAAGRQGLANTLAFQTDMSVEAAVVILSAAAKEAAPTVSAAISPLARAMAQVTNPAVGPDATAGNGAAEGGAETEQSLAHNVVALFNQVKGAK